MDTLGFLFVFVLAFILTSLFTGAAIVTDIKNKFNSYSARSLELKAKRFTVYPLVFMGITAALWVIVGCFGAEALTIVLFFLLIVCACVSATFLLPISIYGIVLASALKNVQEKRYVKSSYRVCGIISAVVSFGLFVVFFALLADIM